MFWSFSPYLNKYAAIVLVLIILIIGYCYFTGVFSRRGRKSGRAGKSGRGKRWPGRGGRSNSKRSSKPNKSDEDDAAVDDDDGGDDDQTQEDKLRADAEELFGMVHDGLSKGMQQDEFKQLAGDLASGLDFVELKQIYNQCSEKGLDPERTVTVEEYVRVLRKNSD
jgi:hypothetical protein